MAGEVGATGMIGPVGAPGEQGPMPSLDGVYNFTEEFVRLYVDNALRNISNSTQPGTVRYFLLCLLYALISGHELVISSHGRLIPHYPDTYSHTSACTRTCRAQKYQGL